MFVLFLELQHVLIVANYFLGLTKTTSLHTSLFLYKSENMSISDFRFWDGFRFD